MDVKQLYDKLELKILAGGKALDKEVTGVYICDLLSWVMAHAQKGDVWITVQTHTNVIAVAALLELSAVIIPEDIEVEAETLKKAEDENIPVLVSSQSAFRISKALVEMGLGS